MLDCVYICGLFLAGVKGFFNLEFCLMIIVYCRILGFLCVATFRSISMLVLGNILTIDTILALLSVSDLS